MNPSARAKFTTSVVPAVFLLVSVWICFEALQVPVGTFRMPGAGFFPLVLGLSLGLLSVMLLGTSLVSPTGGWAPLRPEQPSVVYLAGLTVAAVVLFERVGFLLTMALFLVVAMRMLGRMPWVTVFVVALVGSVTSYVVFVRVLLINLPSGILPF